MPLVNGKVLFNSNCDADINSASNSGIGNVPVVLRNKVTTVGIGVYTSNNGRFSFIGVPAGTYELIEAANYYPPQNSNTIAFSLAQPMEAPTPKDIDITNAILSSSVLGIGNRLISLTPNVQTITVDTDNVTEIIFLDAPVTEVPYINPNVFLIDHTDSIVDASRGTFGILPYGSPTQSSPNEAPYPNLSPGGPGDYIYEKYGLYAPRLGHYSITNIITNNNFGSWWNISDHTTGDESGRMQICQAINTAQPRRIFYESSDFAGVYNNYALLSFWVCNLVKDSISNVPEIKISINLQPGIDAPALAYYVENDTPQGNTPIWRQLAIIVDKRHFSSFNLSIFNTTPLDTIPYNVPNAFAIDDISFRGIIDAPTVTAEKIASVDYTQYPPVITYIINLKNDGPQGLLTYHLDDTIPDGTTLVSNSLFINNSPYPNGELNNKIFLLTKSIPSGTTTSISYKVRVLDNPLSSPIIAPEVLSYYSFKDPINIEQRVDISINSITTTITFAKLFIVLLASPSQAKPRDIINYTITLTNTGTTIANSVTLIDTIPDYTSYLEGSLSINHELAPPGITVNDPLPAPINPNESAVISFDVALADPFPLTAIFTSFGFIYKYSFDPSLPQILKLDYSNSEFVNTRYGKLTLTKAVDKMFLELNEVLTYTISTKNIGNIPTNNIILTDSFDPNVSFVPNSLIINNRTSPISDLIGLNLGELDPNSSLTLTYKVIATTIPESRYINNACRLDYNYFVRPDSDPINDFILSNRVSSELIIPKTAQLSINLFANSKHVLPGNILKYIVTISNVGTVTATSIKLIDTLPAYTSYIQDSLSISSAAVPPNTLPTDTLPNTIEPKEIIEVSFDVLLDNLIPVTSISTSLRYSYKYFANPSLPQSSAIATSNLEVVNTSYGKIDLKKAVDKSYLKLNEILTYTILMKNIGNVSARNIILNDNLDSNVSFVTNSLIINNTPSLINDLSALNLDTLSPSASLSLTFKIKGTTIPNDRYISNICDVNYNYFVEPNTPALSDFSLSNEVASEVILPETSKLSLNLFVYPKVAIPDEKITYTVALINVGTIPATSIKLIDTLPAYTSYIDGSLYINSVAAPPNALPTDTLPNTIEANKSIQVSFDVVLDSSIPITSISTSLQYSYKYFNDIAVATSNVETINTRYGKLDLKKAVDKKYLALNDILTYTLSIKNIGNVSTRNMLLNDDLDPNVSFVANSLVINNIPSSINDLVALNLNTLSPNAALSLTYRVKATTIPKDKYIANSYNVDYNYFVDPHAPSIHSLDFSNEVDSEIIIPQTAKLSIDLFAYPKQALPGDVLRYVVLLTNVGSVSATSIKLIDTLPAYTSYIEGSLYINTLSQSPNLLPTDTIPNTIKPKETLEISFNVILDDLIPVTSINALFNYSYKYFTDPSLPEISVIDASNIEVVTTRYGKLVATKEVDKESVTLKEILTYTLGIKNIGNVSTSNVILYDNLEPSTSFIPNSLMIDNFSLPNNDVSALNLVSLKPNSNITITFKASVTTIPAEDYINNFYRVNYRYITVPTTGTTLQSSVTSNDVDIDFLNNAKLSINIFATPQRVMPGQILSYTVRITNTGTTAANSVKLANSLPTYTSFNNGSLSINDEFLSYDALPTDVLSIPINPKQTVIISFDVVIDNPIPITTLVTSLRYSYTYFQNQFNPEVSGSDISNSISINTRYVELNVLKNVDKDLVGLNEILTYTIEVKNTGNIETTDIVLTDEFDNSVSFVPNSLIINNTPSPNNSLIALNLTSLNANESITLSYKVTVTKIPTTPYILNDCEVNYRYLAIPDRNLIIDETAYSNEAESEFIVYKIATLIKEVNKNFCALNDILDYKIIFTNTTGRTINKLTITDIIPSSLSIIDNSSTINGTAFIISGNTLNKEITNIAPSETVIIVYSANINVSPNLDDTIPIVNTASAKYTLQGFSTEFTTPDKSTTVILNYALLDVIPSATRNSYLNESISYSFTIANSGNIVATDINFIDILPKELQLIPGSLKIDGIVINNSPNLNSLSIPNINPHSNSVLFFKAAVVSLPLSGIVVNNTSINYSYTVDTLENTDVRSITIPIDPLSTNVFPVITAEASKVVDKAIAAPSDEITYSLIIKNITTKTLTDINFLDTIPTNTSLLPNSAFIDGSLVANNNPLKASRPSLNPGDTSTLTFKVKIDATVTTLTINNIGYVHYRYRDILNNFQTSSLYTNIVSTALNILPKPTFTKSVSKSKVYPGDELLYTLAFKNNSLIEFININIVDTIPDNTSLVTDSLTLNGSVYQEGIPLNINLNSLSPGQSSTVSYKVIVNFISQKDPIQIKNSAFIGYKYLDASSTTKSATLNSNEVVTNIDVLPLANISKSVNIKFTDINEPLIYTIAFSNNTLRRLSKVEIQDTLPSNAVLVDNSVAVLFDNTITTVSIPFSILENRISISKTNLPEDSKIFVSYKALAIEDKISNTISNAAYAGYSLSLNPNTTIGINSLTVSTTINYAKLTVTKTVDEGESFVGEALEYLIQISNSGNATATDIIVTDSLQSDLTLVPNSIKVNDVIIPNGNLRNLAISNIEPNKPSTIKFKAVITTLPANKEILNSANVNYKYLDLETSTKKIATSTSNIVITPVSETPIAIFSKYVDKAIVSMGESITYSLVIHNLRTERITDINIVDTLPSETTLMPGSIIINSLPYSDTIPISITLPTLNSGEVATINYQVSINHNLNNVQRIINKGYANYKYIDGFGNSQTVEFESNDSIITLDVPPKTSFTKSVSASVANLGDKLTYTITFTNNGPQGIFNVVLADDIPENTTLVSGSIKLNDAVLANTNNITTVPINLNSGSKVVLVYSVIVNYSLQLPESISNIAKVTYNYRNLRNVEISVENNSNEVTTTVSPFLPAIFTKKVDEIYADKGGKLRYTLQFKNTTAKILSSLTIVDNIPPNSVLLPNSLNINNVLEQLADNTVVRKTFTQVAVNSDINIVFDVLISDTPNVINTISNSAYCDYKFSNAQPNAIHVTTETITTSIANATLTITKSVDKAETSLYDTLSYTISLTNIGNVIATNITLKDIISSDLNLIENSIKVDGSVHITKLNPPFTTNIPDIPPGLTTAITFNAKIIKLPLSGEISNDATVDYSYTVNPAFKDAASASKTSNTVITRVNSILDATLSKIVDKGYAKKGDELLYTIDFTNTTKKNINTLTIVDTLPTSVTIVPNSLIVDSIPKNIIGNVISIPYAAIPANAKTSISYRVIVKNDNSVIHSVKNACYAGYTLSDFPSKLIDMNSAEVNTQINTINIKLLKLVNKDRAYVNDILHYTLEIANQGNTPIANLIVIDTLSSDVTLIPNSMKLNEVVLGNNPNLNSIPIGNLPIGSISILKFDVTINSVPASNVITNFARVNFKYTLDPNLPAYDGYSISETVSTTVSLISSDVLFSKTVDKEYADINDELLYNLTFQNNTTEILSALSIIDTIPDNLLLVPNSLTVDGQSQTSRNSIDITLNNININRIVTISYRTTIISTTSNYRNISNIATANYKPSNPLLPLTTINSNTVLTFVQYAKLSINKIANTDKAYVGDILYYTITITNIGDIPAENVFLQDVLPSQLSLTSNSIKINDITPPEQGNLSNLAIGTVRNGESILITFSAKIIASPPTKVISNYAKVNYNYLINPATQRRVQKSETSKIINTNIDELPQVTFIKVVDKKYADKNTELNYTLTLTNVGSKGLIKNSLLDYSSPHAHFVEGSLLINEVPSTQRFPNVNLPDLNSDEVIVVKYKSKITNDDIVINEVSNIASLDYAFINIENNEVTNTLRSTKASTIVNNARLTASKTTNKLIFSVNDIVTYKILLTNTGNVPAFNIILKDTLNNNLEFVPNSIKVNNSPVSANANLSALSLGTLAPTSNVVITFNARIISIPASNVISNTSYIDYSYQIDPLQNIIAFNTVTANANIDVIIAMPNVSFSKAVNKSFADRDEVLLYTLSIRNNGPQKLIENKIIDNLPINTRFVTDSLVVDNLLKSGSLNSPGISLRDLSAGETLTISYSVLVETNSNKFNTVANSGEFKYSFTDSLGTTQANSIQSNIVSTAITYANLEISKKVSKTASYVSDILTYTTTIINTGNTVATNVLLYENTPNNTVLIPGSIKVNGIVVENNILFGISIPSIAPDESVEIIFMVEITSIPRSNKVLSFANLVYSYTVNSDNTILNVVFNSNINSNSITKNRVSNTVVTTVNDFPLVNLNKSVDKISADHGDELTYTLLVENVTNSILRTLSIADTIPDDSTFVANSLTINGIPKTLNNNNVIQADLTNVPVNSSTIISYKVRVNPENNNFNKITNTVYGSYRVGSPTSTPIKLETNTVTTVINNASLNILKLVDMASAQLNDILTYIISITNIGNVTAYDITLSDNLTEYVTFIEDSLNVSNQIILGSPNLSAINIPTINVKDTIVVTFKVKISKVPPNNVIANIANVNYKYTVSPSLVKSKTASSNITKTTIQLTPIITFEKSVNKVSVQNNEELIYTLNLKNNSHYEITNVNIIDTIPLNTDRADDDIWIENIPRKSPGNIIEIFIPSIASNYVTTISYKVIANSKNINSDKIYNEAYGSYNFIDLTRRLITNYIISNKTETNLTFALLDSKKTSNKEIASVGEILNYVITVSNSGTRKAMDIIVIDNLSSSLQLISDSVNINGDFIPGIPDLTSLEIGDILPGQSVAIILSAKIISAPPSKVIENICKFDYKYSIATQSNIRQLSTNNNEIIQTTSYSNLHSVRINDFANIKFTKSVDKATIINGEILTYTLCVSNTGFTNIVDSTLIDTIPDSTIFINDSLIIDNIASNATIESPGIQLPDLSPGNSTTVTFKVKVSDASIPSSTIINNGYLKYSSVNIDNTIDSLNAISNTVTTKILDAPNLTVTKSVDKSLIQKDEILTYTIAIYNPTNYEASNIILRDSIPEGITLIPCSIAIDTLPYSFIRDLSRVSLSNIKAKETITVVFKTRLTSIPTSNLISNIAAVNYSLNDFSEGSTFISYSNAAKTEIITCSIKNYAHYILKCKFRVCNNGSIPLQNVLINGNTISTFNNNIALSKGYIFQAYWSIIFKVQKGHHDIKGMLTLDESILPGSISISQNTNSSPGIITLNGTALFKSKDSSNYLKLIYEAYSDNPIYVIGSSLKLLELS